MYNITVYLNRVDDQEDFEKARQYFLSKGVPITFNFKHCDVRGYTSYLNTGKWFLGGSQTLIEPMGDVTIFMFDQSEWSNPKGSAFPLRYDTPTGNCIIYNGKPFVNVGYYRATQKEGVVFIEIIHELMHALVRLQWIKGNHIDDIMDSYYKNNIKQYLDADSNFEQQWRILKPYMLPHVTITRTYTDTETLGILEARNAGALFTCHSLELPWKENKSNVSCIPAGTYTVTWSFSPRKLKYTYRVQNVPNRAGILFHSANYVTDLLGCIGLGSGRADINHDGIIDIVNSRVTISAFEGFLGKKPFTLVIK